MFREGLNEYLRKEFPAMMQLWKTLVNMQGATAEKQRVADVLQYVSDILAEEGMNCVLLETEGNPMLLAEDFDTCDKPIILSGHLDTVFPEGTFEEHPFRIEGDKVYGPGVADMKGGIVLIIYIIKALHALGFKKLPIRVLFVGDEENGHQGGIAGDLLTKYAQGAAFALNMETGRLDDCLTTGRKGGAEVRITVSGTGGHAGYDYATAKNAVVEMAHKIIAIQALSCSREGVSVCVDVVHGGTQTNVIPDACYADVDVRFSNNEDWPPLFAQMQEICSMPVSEGTTSSAKILSYMPAFEACEETDELLAKINRLAKKLGIPEKESVFVPGNSDASFLSIARIPVLCSCGIRGGAIHTTDEYAYPESMKERFLLFTDYIAEYIKQTS